jgi:hypothetical protein
MKRFVVPLLTLVPLALTLATITRSASAQSISSVTTLGGCGSDFFSDSSTPATCYSGVVTGCTGADDLQFSFSYDAPASPIGVIVLFSGGSGTSASAYPGAELTYAQDYFNDGYAVIQVAWAWDWEDTTIPSGYTGGGSSLSLAPNIEAAACRPATFLNYINNTAAVHPSGKPVCAQGASAGSGAIGYSTAWYNGASFLKNVELLSGPVFSNIEQGCVVPNAGTQTVCGSGQYGCSSGTTSWTDAPQYVSGYRSGVRGWTGDPSCNGSGNTSSSSNSAWLAMSIVTTGADLTYTSNGMAGWLCSSYQSGTCLSSQGCPNNSAAEGEYFYTNFSSSNHPAAYLLTGITSCNGAEGVTTGSDPDISGESGQTAIESHMTTNCR